MIYSRNVIRTIVFVICLMHKSNDLSRRKESSYETQWSGQFLKELQHHMNITTHDHLYQTTIGQRNTAERILKNINIFLYQKMM